MRKHYTFIRNGVTYSCSAHRVARPLGSAAITEWFAIARGMEVRCFRVSGREFDSPLTTREFEDRIVVKVVATATSVSDRVDSDAILHAEALSPGRFVRLPDGRPGIVQDLDITRKHALVEWCDGPEPQTEWISIGQLALREYRPSPSDEESISD